MGTPPTSEAELRHALEILAKHDGNLTHAATAAGMSRAGFTDRIRKAEARQIKAQKDEVIELPDFIHGDDEEPIDELLARFRKAHERKQKAIDARTWFPLKVKEDKPYGILWFGDPHLGPHCNWALLESHIAIARQPGVYGGNIGDTTDNWPWTGRLARLWAENDISHKTEKRLGTWFMMEAGIKWLLWLGGNHDEWNGGTEFYKMLGASQVPVVDWRAQFTLCHKNGSQTRIDAAHGRKGSSIYNPAHGTLRDAKFGEEAAAYITGHTHNFGLSEIEFAEKRQRTWLCQVAGYKMGDRYALVNGFPQARHGAAVFMVVFPQTGRVLCFSDPEEGADYLAHLRSR